MVRFRWCSDCRMASLILAVFVMARASADESAGPRIKLPKPAAVPQANPLSGVSRGPLDPNDADRPRFMPEQRLFDASRAPAYRSDRREVDDSVGGILSGGSRVPDASAYVPDPAFEKFVNPLEIGRAWDSLDAAGLTDGALGLMEGERVLLRPHRSLSAQDVAAVAARLAIEHGDQASLDRLEKAAKQHGQNAVVELVAASRKLGGASRVAAVAVDISGLSPEQYALCAAVSRAAVRSKVTGDVRYIAPLVTGEGEVVLPGRVPAAADMPLRQRVASLCGDLPETPAVDASVLNLLAARSREDDIVQKTRKTGPPEEEREAKDPQVVTGAY